MSSIKSWAEDERPREKLLNKGADSLSDAELLAILLRTGYKGHSAIDVARTLLQQLGGLREVLRCDCRALSQLPGMGLAKATQLVAALSLGQRFLAQTVATKPLVKNSTETRQYFSLRLQPYRHEVFACLFLNNQHQILSYEELFHGTLNEAVVYPRTIVQRCLYHHANFVILAHNHPSGVTEPSLADRDLTQRISQSLALIDCHVLDHLIIGESTPYSFAEHGLIE